MRASIRCLVLGALAVVAFRYFTVRPDAVLPHHAGGMPWWSALSFALAAVVDNDRAG